MITVSMKHIYWQGFETLDAQAITNLYLIHHCYQWLSVEISIKRILNFHIPLLKIKSPTHS
jgi:hypothetical protein